MITHVPKKHLKEAQSALKIQSQPLGRNIPVQALAEENRHLVASAVKPELTVAAHVRAFWVLEHPLGLKLGSLGNGQNGPLEALLGLGMRAMIINTTTTSPNRPSNQGSGRLDIL